MATTKAPKQKAPKANPPRTRERRVTVVRGTSTAVAERVSGGGNKSPSWDDTLRVALRDFLGQNGLTLRGFCQRTGLNVATVSIFLNQGKRSINLLTAEKIGRAVGLRLTRGNE